MLLLFLAIVHEVEGSLRMLSMNNKFLYLNESKSVVILVVYCENLGSDAVGEVGFSQNQVNKASFCVREGQVSPFPTAKLKLHDIILGQLCRNRHVERFVGRG